MTDSIAEAFRAFDTRISLDQARLRRIRSAHHALRKSAENDAALSQRLVGSFIQGSYAQGTAIRPPKGGTFDVDVVLAFDLTEEGWLDDELMQPEAAIGWLARRVREFPQTPGRVLTRSRCVRIEYQGDFRMDVVIAHAPNGLAGTILVPDKRREEWIRSHPRALIDWCAARNKVTDGAFSRTVRFLKHWRDHRLPESARPSSIALQAMVGRGLGNRFRSDADNVVCALRYIADETGSHEPGWSEMVIGNPVSDGSNLADNWADESIVKFSNYARRASELAESALAAKTERSSKRLWTKVFGDAFPCD